MAKKEIKLSASRIKTIESCSWLYYCKYVLKLPDISNDGAKRGSVTHLALETLLDKKEWKDEYDKIVESGDPFASSKIKELVMKEAKSLEVDDNENLSLIKKFIIAGLSLDFYCDGGELQDPELKFDIINKEPRYRILGFMDKVCIYQNKVRIIDYKTSKKKFSSKEMDNNMQGLMYQIAAKHLWPDKKDQEVEFQFLGFPKSPIQICNYGDAFLEGQEVYFAYLMELMEGFGIEGACASFAYDGGFDKKWMCGSVDPNKWQCPFKKGYYYYALQNENGEIIKTSRDKKELVPKEKETVKKMIYRGCPRHPNLNQEIEE